MNMRALIAQTLLTLIALICACPVWSANFNVTVGGGGNTFSPNNLTIVAGDTVTFQNAGGFHNVVSDAAGFRCATSCTGSGGNASSAGWTAVVTFNTPGAFDFYCDVHGAAGVGMFGTLTVGAAPAPPPLGAGYTGTWYDTLQSGHGIFVEILPGNLMLAYWFTFTPDGQQAWFGGVGSITGNTATMTAVRSTGARFIPNFNPTDVVRTNWGTLTFTFTDCSNGRVDFNSIVGFGTGSMTLKRLTLPAGLTCPPPATATAHVDANQ